MPRRSLILLLLGLVVATAPAATCLWVPRAEAAEPAPPDGEKEPEQEEAKSPVYLRSVPAADHVDSVDDFGGVTPEVTPALRARRLHATPQPAPALLRRRDDLRPGLLAIPPPAA